MSPTIEPAMTVKDVARFLNVDEITIYRLSQEGDLPGFKVAGAWRDQRSDIQSRIDERKSSGSAADATKNEGS